jgi:hypothetical protein
MNDENLIPMNRRTKSEQREIARRGGIASGESRRKRKMLREQLVELLEFRNTQNLICTNLVDKAIRGDARAFEVIRDTIGENPRLLREKESRGELNNA